MKADITKDDVIELAMDVMRSFIVEVSKGVCVDDIDEWRRVLDIIRHCLDNFDDCVTDKMNALFRFVYKFLGKDFSEYV